MENLEIISTQVTVQAKEVINGDTVNYSWNNAENTAPNVVNFNVMRGTTSEPDYTGNRAISGAYYSANEKFDVQNNNFIDGDLTLYNNILKTCRAIVTETVAK